MDRHINHNHDRVTAARTGDSVARACREDGHADLDHGWIYGRNWIVDEDYHQRKYEGNIRSGSGVSPLGD